MKAAFLVVPSLKYIFNGKNKTVLIAIVVQLPSSTKTLHEMNILIWKGGLGCFAPIICLILASKIDKAMGYNQKIQDFLTSLSCLPILTHRLMLITAGQTENSSPLSSPVSIRVKIHGHHPNGKREIGTTPKLITLPDSVEDLFRVAGMSITSYIQNALHGSKVIQVVSQLINIEKIIIYN